MISRRRLSRPCRAALLFVCLLIPLSCLGMKFRTSALSIRRADGMLTPLTVELAETDEQRAQGLMRRRHLEDGKGMLFIFEQDQVMSFWMKDTYIPLSIAYIASDGRILEIYDMEPQSLASVKSVRSVRYALEVPRGWFGRAGIALNDVVFFNK